ncbi:hypothetical protein GCM10027299_55300 [Larkinella ripae]
MIQAVRKYLLTQCLVLLCGCGFLSATSHQEYHSSDAVKILEETAPANVKPLLSNQAVTLKKDKTPDSKAGESYTVFSEKEEEDSSKSLFPKKRPEVRGHFPVFHTHLFRYLSGQVKRRLFVSDHRYYSAASRYLFFCVIRI